MGDYAAWFKIWQVCWILHSFYIQNTKSMYETVLLLLLFLNLKKKNQWNSLTHIHELSIIVTWRDQPLYLALLWGDRCKEAYNNIT